MPRAWTCGSAKTRSMLLIGPQGTPTGSSTALHSSSVRCRVMPFNVAISSTRLLQPIDVGREARVVGKFRVAGHVAKFAKLAVVADGEREMPVAGLEDAVRHHVLMLVAGAGRCLAPDQIVHGLVGEPGHLRVEQGEVDVLAARGALPARERGEDRGRRVHAGHQVGSGDAHLLRPAAGQVVTLAGDAHDPAHGLGDQIVAGAVRIGPRLAEARDRAIDQARIDLAERGIVEAEFGEPADLVVLDQDIRAFHKLPYHRLPLGRGEIEGDRALPPIGGHVVGGVVVGLDPGRVAQEGRPPGARVVADAEAVRP